MPSKNPGKTANENEAGEDGPASAQKNNETAADDGGEGGGETKEAPASNTARNWSKLGRRGDPRMHAAVAARLADPDLSSLEALRRGGFVFPVIESAPGGKVDAKDDKILDTDNVPLCQRKNQLSRRLRLAKKARQQQLLSQPGFVAMAVSQSPAKGGKRRRKKGKKGKQIDSTTMTSALPPHAAPQLAILGMGGTIDKDYPRATGGYAFEMTDQLAAHRVVTGLSPYVHLDVATMSVRVKDSTDLTDDDRDALVRAIRDCPADRIVVTHGTDTMIETARYVRSSGVVSKEGQGEDGNKVVAFTGAMQPQRFKGSDAEFNVGGAVAATSILEPGSIVVCMGANVIPCDDCVRCPTTGLFLDQRRISDDSAAAKLPAADASKGKKTDASKGKKTDASKGKKKRTRRL